MASTLPGDKIAIIKYAQGGTSLFSDWKADLTAGSANDGAVYRTFQSVVSSGLTALENDPALSGYTMSIDGLLWVQGESDIDLQLSTPLSNAATNYAANLIGDARLTYGEGLAFYFSEVSFNQTTYTSSPERTAALNTLRAAQESVAASVEGAYLIATDASSFTVKSGQVL